MASIPYTPTPATIPKFLQHIQSAGVPQKVTQSYLASVGFKSTNDRQLMSVLKAIDFIDANGVPTERWKAYRDKSKATSVLGAAIQYGYSDLFATFPDAYRKDDEAVRNFFSSKSDLSEGTLALAVRTFKALSGKANFEGVEPEEQNLSELTRRVPPNRPGSGGPATVININIQLQIPATDEAGVYEKLFEALRKNLLPDGSNS